jgi:hypothetical protein
MFAKQIYSWETFRLNPNSAARIMKINSTQSPRRLYVANLPFSFIRLGPKTQKAHARRLRLSP